MANQKSVLLNLLMIVGLFLGVGSALNAVARPGDRFEFVMYSLVGFAMIAWAMVKSRRTEDGPDSSRDPD